MPLLRYVVIRYVVVDYYVTIRCCYGMYLLRYVICQVRYRYVVTLLLHARCVVVVDRYVGVITLPAVTFTLITTDYVI